MQTGGEEAAAAGPASVRETLATEAGSEEPAVDAAAPFRQGRGFAADGREGTAPSLHSRARAPPSLSLSAPLPLLQGRAAVGARPRVLGRGQEVASLGLPPESESRSDEPWEGPASRVTLSDTSTRPPF